MKKNCMKKGLKAALAISVLFALVIPGATVFANNEQSRTINTVMNKSLSGDVMKVQNTTANQGAVGHELYVTGTWSTTIGGYEMAMYYDATKLEIADVNLEGTVADYSGSEWLVYWSYNDAVTPAYVLASAITWSTDVIAAGSGNIFKLVVNVSGSAPAGDTVLDLAQSVGPLPSYCSYSDPSGGVIFPDLIDGKITISTVVCGDANGDHAVGLGDAIYILNYLFKHGTAPSPLCVADANGDGAVGLGDAIYILNYLFKHGDPPVPDCCS